MIALYFAPYQIRRIKVFVTLILLFTLTFTWIVERFIGDLFLNLAKVRINQIITEEFTKVVLQELESKEFQTEKLIRIEKDQKGKITLVQSNTLLFHKLAARIGNRMQKHVNSLRKQKVAIPIGQLFGLKVLASFGPKIKISFIPMGYVEVKCLDSFESGGLNQTRFQLSVILKASYKVAIPFVSEEAKLSYKLPIIETVIVGEVPQIMLPSSLK